MRRRTPLIPFLTLLTVAFLSLAGCDRKPAGPPPIDRTAVVGDWREIDASEFGNVRIQSAEPLKFHRRVVIREDGAFEFNLVKKSGDPHGTEKISGTWDIDVEKNEVVFTVDKNQFKQGGERHGWAPASSKGVRQDRLAKEGETDAITITDATGTPVSYKRIK